MEPKNDWPAFWPNKARMTKKEFAEIISRYEKVPRIVVSDDIGKLINLVKLLVVELAFLERVVEEYEKEEVKF